MTLFPEELPVIHPEPHQGALPSLDPPKKTGAPSFSPFAKGGLAQLPVCQCRIFLSVVLPLRLDPQVAKTALWSFVLTHPFAEYTEGWGTQFCGGKRVGHPPAKLLPLSLAGGDGSHPSSNRRSKVGQPLHGMVKGGTPAMLCNLSVRCVRKK